MGCELEAAAPVSLTQPCKRDHRSAQGGSDSPHHGLERFRNSKNFWTLPITLHWHAPDSKAPQSVASG
jgi:hypothetical protein